MTEPYCRKHGHWDCPKCGKEDRGATLQEVIAFVKAKILEWSEKEPSLKEDAGKSLAELDQILGRMGKRE